MTRKEFLKTGFLGLSVGLGALVAARCKSSTSPEPTGDTKTFTSSNDSGHTHSITINKSEVQTPPASGISRETSTNSGHSHTFTMTQAQLTNVNNGGTEMCQTAMASSHMHTFSIAKWF